MMSDLALPGRPVVRHIVSPEIHLVPDALLAKKRTEALGRLERPGRVLPLALATDENQRCLAAQPVEVIPAEVRDVLHRGVEVNLIAALAAALHGHVVHPAHPHRDREEIRMPEAEARCMRSAER